MASQYNVTNKLCRNQKNNLTEKMKQIREKLALPQEKPARLTDVSNNTIINIETGKQNNPIINTLKKLAKALNLSVEELILNL